MKYVPFAVVLVVLGVGTYIEGKLSDRWGQETSAKLDRFTERVTKIPLEIGEWKGTPDEINMEEFEASNCTGFFSATYTNRDGQQINVYLVSGSARHVTIHTPDWCYVGAGYVMDHEPQQYTLTDCPGVETPPEFLTTMFQKEDVMGRDYLRIFWGFSDNGDWLGPRMAKESLAGRSAMYKVYMITRIDGRRIGKDIETNPTLDFARKFIPTVNNILFQPADSEI